MAILKDNKAAGRDDVLVEQLKNIGPKIITILKPGNDCDSKELLNNIPLVSYVHPLRKNGTEQKSINHRTAPN